MRRATFIRHPTRAGHGYYRLTESRGRHGGGGSRRSCRFPGFAGILERPVTGRDLQGEGCPSAEDAPGGRNRGRQKGREGGLGFLGRSLGALCPHPCSPGDRGRWEREKDPPPPPQASSGPSGHQTGQWTFQHLPPRISVRPQSHPQSFCAYSGAQDTPQSLGGGSPRRTEVTFPSSLEEDGSEVR